MSQDNPIYVSSPLEDDAAGFPDDAFGSALTVTTGPTLMAKLGAEAFGTFILVLISVGAAIFAALGAVGGGALGIALATAIAIAGAAGAVGHISGGHFNPALTLGSAISGRTPWADVLPYWVSQLIGGAAASAILFVTISGVPALGDNVRTFFSTAANGFGDHSPLAAAGVEGGFTLAAALIIELVATAILVAIVLGVTHSRARNSIAPLTMGLTYGALLLVTLPVTNGSLNPARSFAAALFSESWAFGQLWLFWVAPLAGAGIAALIYRLVAVNPADAAVVDVYDFEYDELTDEPDELTTATAPIVTDVDGDASPDVVRDPSDG